MMVWMLLAGIDGGGSTSRRSTWVNKKQHSECILARLLFGQG
jgi:hypothetical protein